MKCLMIKPEYIMELSEGVKAEEYRSWTTDFRGDIFLGCSSTPVSNAFIAYVATLTDIYYDDAENIYHWVLDDIRAVKPIKVVGKLRLFETGIDQYEELDDADVEKTYRESATWIVK